MNSMDNMKKCVKSWEWMEFTCLFSRCSDGQRHHSSAQCVTVSEDGDVSGMRDWLTDRLTDWLTVLHLTLSITVRPSDWVEWQLTSHRPQQNVKLNFTLVTVMTWRMTWWYGRSKSWSSRQENPDLHIVKHQKVTYTADARRWWTKVILIRVGFL